MKQALRFAAALLLLDACGDDRRGEFTKTGERVVVSRSVSGASLPLSTPAAFYAEGQNVGTVLECDGYEDSTPCSGKATCSGSLVPTPTTNPLEVEVVSATCAPPAPGEITDDALKAAPVASCTATVAPPGTVSVTATTPGVAAVIVVTRKRDGSGELTGRTTVVFDEPGSIEVSRRISDSPAWADNVLLPDQQFAWCGSVLGKLGLPLSGGTVDVAASGVVEKTDERDEDDPCPVFHAKEPGRGVVTFTAGSLTRTENVDVVAETAVTGVELVDLGPWVSSSDGGIATSAKKNPISDAAPLTARTLDPLAYGRCFLSAGARFKIADGRVGLAPETAVTADPANLGVRSSSPRAGSNDAIADFVMAGPGADVTIRAALNAQSASVPLHLGEKCNTP